MSYIDTSVIDTEQDDIALSSFYIDTPTFTSFKTNCPVLFGTFGKDLDTFKLYLNNSNDYDIKSNMVVFLEKENMIYCNDVYYGGNNGVFELKLLKQPYFPEDLTIDEYNSLLNIAKNIDLVEWLKCNIGATAVTYYKDGDNFIHYEYIGYQPGYGYGTANASTFYFSAIPNSSHGNESYLEANTFNFTVIYDNNYDSSYDSSNSSYNNGGMYIADVSFGYTLVVTRSYSNATTNYSGLMSSIDKRYLDYTYPVYIQISPGMLGHYSIDKIYRRGTTSGWSTSLFNLIYYILTHSSSYPGMVQFYLEIKNGTGTILCPAKIKISDTSTIQLTFIDYDLYYSLDMLIWTVELAKTLGESNVEKTQWISVVPDLSTNTSTYY